MPREIMRDDIPRPGAALTNEVDAHNQALIDAEVQRRIAMVSARLTRWQRWQLHRRAVRLGKYLQSRDYNGLVAKRDALANRIAHLRERISSDIDHNIKRLYACEGRRLVSDIRALHEMMRPLDELAHEYRQMCDKLSSHYEAVRWMAEDRDNQAAFRREAITWLEQMRAVMRHSERLRHRWQDERGRWYVDIPQFERLLFKDDKVYYHLATTRQGLLERLLGRWHSALPDNVDVTDLTSEVTLANLSAACRRRVSVEWSKKGANLYYVISRLDSPDGIPSQVMYNNVIDWYPVQDHAKTPWCAGVGEDRQVIWYTLEDHPHILIAGSTQSGKSNHINQMIATWVTMFRPDELRLILVDLKGGIEFTHWSDVHHLIGEMVTTPDGALDALIALKNMMSDRLAMFERVRAKKLAVYNRKSPNKLPRIIMVIDEMATLIGLGDMTAEIHRELRVLSSQGRAVGIHLVICTQHTSVEVIPGWIKTNMSLRGSGKMPSRVSSEIILDTGSAALMPSIPGRMVFSIGRSEVMVQSPLISDAEIARAVNISQAYPKPDDEAPTQTRPVFGRDELLDMVIDELDGSLSPAKVHEIVGNEIMPLRKLREMVHDILTSSQGGLVHRGIAYKIKKNRAAYYLIPEPSSEHQIAATGD